MLLLLPTYPGVCIAAIPYLGGEGSAYVDTPAKRMGVLIDHESIIYIPLIDPLLLHHFTC